MIFVDANILLRALTWSTQPEVQRQCRLAADLLRRADGGDAEITTSDAVIADAAFILTAKSHYNLPVDEAAGRLSALLRANGFRIRQKPVLMHAFDLWVEHPKLGFVDMLTAAYTRQSAIELATFDQDFDRFADIARWKPDNERD